jgi:hypothetical protein
MHEVTCMCYKRNKEKGRYLVRGRYQLVGEYYVVVKYAV